jgi:hypothetical protein
MERRLLRDQVQVQIVALVAAVTTLSLVVFELF